MVKLQVKVIFKYIFHMVLFLEESVNTHRFSNEEIDFQEVLAENSQYPPVKDLCTRRILGGSTVDIEEVPYQIMIVQSDSEGDRWKLVCGGAIVTHHHIVSAAHCFKTEDIKTYYRVVAGAGQANMIWNRKSMETSSQIMSSEIWRRILNGFTHKLYSRRLKYDFAVLKLDVPVNFSSCVQPIPMLKPSHGISLKEGDLCMVTGFGITENLRTSQRLQMVCLPFVPRDKCANLYRYRSLSEHQFCAGDRGRDSCKGDSGGPLTFQGYLIGIVSYGGICGHEPGIYTRISLYTTNEFIPLAISHCVKLSLNILRIVCSLFSIFVHNFVVTNLFILNKFCA